MIYDIAHRHDLQIRRAGRRRRAARCACCRATIGGQARAVDSDIELSPRADIVSESDSTFSAIESCEARIDKPHTKLQITLAARVAVERRRRRLRRADAGLGNRRANAAYASKSLARRLARALAFIRAGLRRCSTRRPHYARESFPPGRPILEGAIELTRRIHADFAYDPDATHIATPLAQAFERRRGVCQDFAHIMIAGSARPRPAGVLCQRLSPHLSGARPGAARRRRRLACLGLGVVRAGIRLASISIRPTPSSSATTISSSPSDAIMPTFRRSTA